jgi:hypothetical protein
MADERALARADLVLLPDGWDGDLGPSREASLTFVVQVDEGEPTRLAKVNRLRHAGQIKDGIEQGEALHPAHIELPGGRPLDIRFSRQGAIWEEGGKHVLLPAERSFAGPEEVEAILSQPDYLALTGEPILGHKETLPPASRWVLMECPGPPPHLVTLARGERFCSIHPGVETAPA